MAHSTKKVLDQSGSSARSPSKTNSNQKDPSEDLFPRGATGFGCCLGTVKQLGASQRSAQGARVHYRDARGLSGATTIIFRRGSALSIWKECPHSLSTCAALIDKLFFTIPTWLKASENQDSRPPRRPNIYVSLSMGALHA